MLVVPRLAFFAVLFLLLVAAPARAADLPDAAAAPCEDAPADAGGACPLDDLAEPAAIPPAGASTTVTLLFFWGVGCPHCEEAKPFVSGLAKEEPRLRVDWIEVRKDPEGRKRFIETMKALGAAAVGVPTFVVGREYAVGWTPGQTDREVRAMISRALAQQAPLSPRTIDVPILGRVEPASVSLPTLTLAVGLVDGVNPCAMWVLLVLLGILLHVDTTGRMLLYAGTFVVMSGVVYFIFMTAWSTLFELAGLSRVVTMILGGLLVTMGLVNLKDLVWFKKGPSLVIPEKVKPRLYRRMRAIAHAASLPAALGGTVVLAFVVNLVELGCTLGLPAIYTRILSLRDLSASARYGYLALYNVAYVVPLLVIVLAFVLVRRKVAMSERAARVLKGVSGLLLTSFGALFLLAPDLLAST